MDCYYCPNYKADYGPLGVSYCRGFQATLSDKDNLEGGKEFSKYYAMDGRATNACPKGSHSSDYD